MRPTMNGSSPTTSEPKPLRNRSAPPEPSPSPVMPASVCNLRMSREALGWLPPMGALAIQKRSLSAFSRCRTSMPVTFIGFAAARGRSPCGVLASMAAGPAIRVAARAWRRVIQLFSIGSAAVDLFGDFDQLFAEQRILRIFGREGHQQLLRLARLLFP